MYPKMAYCTENSQKTMMVFNSALYVVILQEAKAHVVVEQERLQIIEPTTIALIVEKRRIISHGTIWETQIRWLYG